MVQRLLLFVTAFFVAVGAVFAQQTAQMQLIHNIPDPELLKCDIYIDGVKTIDNFAYHSATAMISIPAGTAVTIAVKDSNSGVATAAVATWNINLQTDAVAACVLDGVKNKNKFYPNPDGLSIGLTLIQQTPRPLESADSSSVDLIFHHGAPEYSRMRIVNRGYQEYASSIQYMGSSSYVSTAPRRSIIDLIDVDDENHLFGSFDADLSAYKGEAMVVVFSGKFGQTSPSILALSMIGVLPDGTVVPFTAFDSPISMLQIIHNSPDPDLKTIDVYVDNDLVADNIEYRQATPVVIAKAGTTIRITIAPSNSISAAQALETPFAVSLEESMNYAFFLSGLRNTSGYTSNPDNKGIGFNFFQLDDLRLKSDEETQFMANTANMTTDLPSLTVEARNAQVLGQYLMYGRFSGYSTINPENYMFDVYKANEPETLYATFFADTRDFAGKTGIIFTSGFHQPENNNNGPDLRMYCAFPDGDVVEFPKYIPPEAQLQIAHNSPDPALQTVDVYVNDNLIADNLSFRSATGILDIPAEEEVTVVFAPENSSGPENAYYTTTFTPVDETGYFMLFQGVQDPTAYAVNPNGENLALNAAIREGIRYDGVPSNEVQLTCIQGSMDNIAIDLRPRVRDAFFTDMIYGKYDGIETIQPQSYLVDMTESGTDTTQTLRTYVMNFSSFGGTSIILFTSGFVTPSANNNGPEFGLYGVFHDGRVFRYNEYIAPTAQIQFVNNCPDVSLPQLDVYVNDDLVADNLNFQTATGYLDIPADEQVSVYVAPPTSTSSAEALASFTFTPKNNVSYFSMISGVSDPGQYAGNPDAVDISLQMQRYDSAKTYAKYLDEIEINMYNGTTDAPALTLREREGASVIQNVAFGSNTGYITYPLISGLFDLVSASDTSILYGSYLIDLSSYGGKSGVLFVSGYIDPAQNQNGTELGLFMAFPDGTVVEFTREQAYYAELQIIHNAPDSRAALVDVYINGELVANDLSFLHATPYLEVRARKELTIAIAPSFSTSANMAYTQQPITLDEETRNMVIVQGVVDPSGFAANPDNVSIGMAVLNRKDIRTEALDSTKADFLFIHGTPDLGTIDFIVKDGSTMFSNAMYNSIQNYISMDIAEYEFQIVLSADTDSIVARFDGDITDLKGFATTIFSSGFYDTTKNENGLGLSLYAAFPNGSVVPFDKLVTPTGTDDVRTLPLAGEWNIQVSPNPVSGIAHIRFALAQKESVSIAVYDQLGRTQFQYDLGSMPAGDHIYSANLSGLLPGTYIVQVRTLYGSATHRIAVIR